MAMSPRPPPPTEPAIAEYPRIVPMAIVAPVISDVLDSSNSTFTIILKSLAPIDLAAYTTPASTSLIDDSTIRPINGIAATTNGTTVADEP